MNGKIVDRLISLDIFFFVWNHNSWWKLVCGMLTVWILDFFDLEFVVTKISFSQTIFLLCGIWMLIWYVYHINAFYQMATLYDNAFYRCFESLYGVELGRTCKKVNLWFCWGEYLLSRCIVAVYIVCYRCL